MLKFRAAENKDSIDIYEWRNDEHTRLMSHTTNLVEWEEHSKWFADSLKNKNRLLVICEDFNPVLKIAVVRFDIQKDRAVISINLAPHMRGKGLAKKCLKGAILFFKSSFSNISFIDAEIKVENTPSKLLFESAGFIFIKRKDEILYYEYTL